MATSIGEVLGILIIGQPIKYGALGIYPLKSDRAVPLIHYLVLEEAIKTGAFRITEVSESGTVPQLRAINETPSPVFLLDGEQLIGAKQNRVLNLSLMLAAKSESEIPVACVEAGRWRSQSREFLLAEEAYYASGRAEKMEQVSSSLRSVGAARCDQSAVWDSIARKSARMNASSPTSASHRVYEIHREEVQSYVDAMPTQPGQIGAVFAIGGAVSGIELFDNEATFKKLVGKLAASYALDAIELPNDVEPPDVGAVRSFVDAVRSAPQERATTVGMGETVRLSTDEVVGAALEVNGSCVHLAAFRRDGVLGGARARR